LRYWFAADESLSLGDGTVPSRTLPARTEIRSASSTGKETICPAEVGHRSATICHLGNIGYRLHRKLTWDPVTEVFPDDAKASAELSREPRAKWKM